MSSSAELWYVKLADGDVHRVNLDQLDDAFQAGHIDASTMVLAGDSTQWTTLGQLLGLENEEDATLEQLDADVAPLQIIAQPSGRPTPAPVPLAAPEVQARTTSNVLSRPTLPFPQVPQSRGAEGYAPALITASPSPLATPVYGQVDLGSVQRVPSAPATSASRAPSSLLPVPNSLRPLSVDFGDFESEVPRPRRAGKRVFAALVGLALVGGVAGVATSRPTWARPVLSRVGLQSSTPAVAAAPPGTIDAPPPPVAEPPAPPQVAPAASAASAGPGESPLSPRFTDRSSPESKTKGTETADKKAVKRAKSAGSAVSAPHGSAKSKSSTFTTGGNKYDPLNSSI